MGSVLNKLGSAPCIICNYLVSLLYNGNDMCSKTGMCFRKETLCCMTGMCFSVKGIYSMHAHGGILSLQSGSDLATQSLIPILKVYHLLRFKSNLTSII